MVTADKSKEKLLRQREEKELSKTSHSAAKTEETDVRKLLHELQTHQVELEAQNEALREAQAIIEESRMKYSDLYDFAPIGYFTFDPSGMICEVNLTGARLLDIERENLIHRPFLVFVEAGFQSRFLDHLLTVLNSGKKERCDLKLIKRDGDSLDVSLLSIAMADGESTSIRSALIDITDRKQADAALMESESKYRIVAEHPYNWEFWTSPEGEYIYVSPSCKRITGHDPEEFLRDAGLRREIIFPEDLPIFDRHRQEEGEEVIASEIQYRIVHADGSIRWIGHVCKRIFDEKERFLGIRGTNRDITERKVAEEALREAHGRAVWLAQFPDQNPNPIIRASADGTVLYCNAATAKHHGWRCEVGQVLQNELLLLLGRPMAEGAEVQHDIELDGRFYSVWVAPFSGEGYANLYGRDITERKQAEEAMRESEERFKLSMEATSDGLWDWNAVTDEVYYSPSYYRILGYEPNGFPCTLQAWKERIHPEDLERTLQVNMDCIEGRSESFAVEYRMKAKNGEWRWILGRGKCITRDAQGRAIRLIGTHIDITERKQAEEQIQRQMKDLQAVNEELTRFNRAAVGRELRMIELKREINTLCAKAGQPPRYPLEFEKSSPS